MTPREGTAWIGDALIAALEQAGNEGIGAAIRGRVAELEGRTRQLVANDLDHGNVGFAILAAAAYLELRARGIGRAAAMSAVDAALNLPLRQRVLDQTRAMLDEAADPYAALVDASRARERDWFGPSWVFERPVDDGFGYTLHIRRCLFHEALRACGTPEIQPIVCRFDLNWVDAIDPARHPVRFERPSTFASADTCRMWFVRKEQLDEPTDG
ncbi:MAG: L-2-amino-thiazoline-4-carboxylic acid hydrolase [Myxococcota bacterium]